MIAKIVLNKNSRATDRLFDYVIPEHIESISVGTRVNVPFGRNNKPTEGYILYLCDTSDCENLKEISGLIDNYSYFDSSKVEIIEFMRHRYFCSYISAVKCFVPSGLGINLIRYYSLSCYDDEYIKNIYKHSVTADKIISTLKAYGEINEEHLKTEVGKKNVMSVLNKFVSEGVVSVRTKENENIKDVVKTFVELAIDREEAYSLIDAMALKAKARARALEVVCDNSIIELSELLMYASCSKSVVDALHERGYITYSQVICNNPSVDDITEIIDERRVLTKEQRDAVDKIYPAIENSLKETFLIHGVTGSGKTEVYLRLIEKVVDMGKEAIFLVPEISLTPQMISHVYSRFGNNVAVLHSKLTLRQRYNEWKRIKNKDVKIVIGARSAIFAPFSNVGIIIIDEEHETTYKSEMSPRYNALEVARFMSRQQQCVLILASATPSVDSYYKASLGIFKLIEMPSRANNAPLPEVRVCDMRKELEDGNMSIFSKDLKCAIDRNLSAGEQSILFLNRRGFSGFVSCRNCGYVQKCPNCNVSMTYHKSNSMMVCHYCDYKTNVPQKCPSCGSNHIKFFGIGTEKVVDELNKIFPNAKVLRMDADTTGGRMSHETILKTFGDGNADILVGTQMITKGLNFENVTLVGIIAADMSLCVDDYRAGERTFDLITQVIGRAGRAKKHGYAIIQTYNPEDEVIIMSSLQDYKGFYNNEIETRMILKYPPFSEFINFVFSSRNLKNAQNIAGAFHMKLCSELKKTTFDGVIFKPCKSPIFKLNGKYRYHFLIKTAYKKDIYNIIDSIYRIYVSNKEDVTVSVDVNPNNI